MQILLCFDISNSYTELKFQFRLAKMTISDENFKFFYNLHFFQRRMKIWYYARANSFFIFERI